ncbi:hypothetical protein GUJ93_ZPchr0001g31743 [Zizania palustris]|uniref:Uncharacterized protein n=1 Tax=Zizania palustris TaxID=103762 RepID=A0A8J5RZN2_ZIZPA|nr:hypothetical protein GUJ93_ZPchr0001g31743 [Zizania palustris]
MCPQASLLLRHASGLLATRDASLDTPLHLSTRHLLPQLWLRCPHHRSSATPTPDLVLLGLPSSSSGTATPYHNSGFTAPTTDLASPHPKSSVPSLPHGATPPQASPLRPARCESLCISSEERCGRQPTQFKTAAGIVKRL